MKKLLALALLICMLIPTLASCGWKYEGTLAVTFDGDDTLFTTDMTEKDLREHISVRYYPSWSKKNIEVGITPASEPKGREMSRYKLSCDIQEGECELIVEYRKKTWSTKVFFFDKSKFVTEGDFLFYSYQSKDYLVKYNGSASELTLPDRGGYAIFDKAFKCNTTLTRLDLGDSVTGIGVGAFYGCTSLSEVYFGSALEVVCNDAFTGCTSLSKVDAPSVKDWCDIKFAINGLFVDPSNLEMVYFVTDVSPLYTVTPEFYNLTVSNVKNGAYYTVDSSGSEQFCYYLSVSNPLTLTGALFVDGEHITELVIPEDVTKINYLAFSGADITSVRLHDGITSIGSVAFIGCEKLEKVSIGGVSRDIANCNFKNAFPEQAMNKYEGAFYLGNEENPYMILVSKGECVESINIHEDTLAIAAEAFKRVYQPVYINGEVTNAEPSPAFGAITVPDSVRFIGRSAFTGDFSSHSTIHIGSGVEYIGERAFASGIMMDLTFANTEGWYYLEGEERISVNTIEIWQITVSKEVYWAPAAE